MARRRDVGCLDKPRRADPEPAYRPAAHRLRRELPVMAWTAEKAIPACTTSTRIQNPDNRSLKASLNSSSLHFLYYRLTLPKRLASSIRTSWRACHGTQGSLECLFQ